MSRVTFPLWDERGGWRRVLQAWHDCSAMRSQGKGERMTEDGILGIIKRGNTYQVRYASYNPHGMDRPSYQCPDEGTLVALLRRCGMDP